MSVNINILKGIGFLSIPIVLTVSVLYISIGVKASTVAIIVLLALLFIVITILCIKKGSEFLNK